MARIPDKQAVFFELDGVLIAAPRLEPDGSLPWFPGAREALGRIDPAIFKIFIATNRASRTNWSATVVAEVKIKPGAWGCRSPTVWLFRLDVNARA